MAVVIKTIHGRKYRYEVTWDKDKKRHRWRYMGAVDRKPKVSKRVMAGKSIDIVLDRLYNRVKRDDYMGLTKKQLDKLRHHIKSVRGES